MADRKTPRGRDGVMRTNIMGKRSNFTRKEPTEDENMKLTELPFDLTDANVDKLALAIG